MEDSQVSVVQWLNKELSLNKKIEEQGAKGEDVKKLLRLVLRNMLDQVKAVHSETTVFIEKENEYKSLENAIKVMAGQVKHQLGRFYQHVLKKRSGPDCSLPPSLTCKDKPCQDKLFSVIKCKMCEFVSQKAGDNTDYYSQFELYYFDYEKTYK